MERFNFYINILGFLSLIGGAVLILMSKVKTDNLNDLKQRVEILEKEREFAREQHLKNQKAISNLEGQLATYKEIPLKNIADSLQTLPGLVKSNDEILKTLQGSADIAKQDAEYGGLLVKTKPNKKGKNAKNIQ